jgi:hypothetical protein
MSPLAIASSTSGLAVIYFIFRITHSHIRMTKTAKSSENAMRQDLGGNDHLNMVHWSRKNGILHIYDKYKKDPSNMLFFTKSMIKEAEAIAFCFLKGPLCLKSKQTHHFDISLYNDTKPMEFLFRILERLGIYSRTGILIDQLAEVVLKQHNTEDHNKKIDKDALLDEFRDKCRKKKIGIIFKNIHQTPADMQDIVSAILKNSDRIVCTASEFTPFVNSLIKSGLVRRHVITPLDGFSYVFAMSNRLMAQRYRGVDYKSIQVDTLKDHGQVAQTILPESDKPLYWDAYLATGGNLFYKPIIDPFIGMSSSVDSKPLSERPEIYAKIFHENFKDSIDRLSIAELKILQILCLLPFSANAEDIVEFCKNVGADYSITFEKLLSNELVYESKPYKYVNIAYEMHLLRNDHPELYYKHFATLESGKSTGQLGESRFVGNAKNASPALRMLIDRSLMQRFHNSEGYYTTNLVRRFILDQAPQNDLTSIRAYLCEYFRLLAEKRRHIGLRLLSKATDYFFGDSKQALQIEAEELLVEAKQHREMDQVIYFSAIYRESYKIVVPYFYHYLNSFFCLRHIAEIPLYLSFTPTADKPMKLLERVN